MIKITINNKVYLFLKTSFKHKYDPDVIKPKALQFHTVHNGRHVNKYL